jgi:hypothetical protein
LNSLKVNLVGNSTRYQNWYHLTPKPMKSQYLQIFISGSVECKTDLTHFHHPRTTISKSFFISN